MLISGCCCVSQTPFGWTTEPAATLTPYGYEHVTYHTIIGSPDGDLENYQVKLTIHQSGGTDSGPDVYLNMYSHNWPNDIRFVDAENRSLSYWIESSDALKATVWVKMPTIPGYPRTTTIAIHYGKSGDPGNSDLKGTMIFGDDFNDYAGWDTYYYDTSGSAYTDYGVLKVACAADDRSYMEGVKRTQSFTSDHTAWGVRMFASGGDALLYALTFSPTIDPWHYRSWYRVDAGEDCVKFESNTNDTPITSFTDVRADNKHYHVYEIRFDGSRVGYSRDGLLFYSEPALIRGNLYPGIENARGNGSTMTYVDFFYIRKYTPNEPGHSAPGEEAYVTVTPEPALGYSFIKDGTIRGSTDGPLSNYPIRLTIHRDHGTDSGRDVYLNGRSQSWPDDIRFTDSDNKPLGYWVESSDAATATVWVKMNSLPASPGVSTVYLHYGKKWDMGNSNIKSVMMIGDDFDGYSTWYDYHDGPPGILSGGDGVLNITCGEGGAPATEGARYPDYIDNIHTAWGVRMCATGGEAHFYALTSYPSPDPWHSYHWYRVNVTADHASLDINNGSYSRPYNLETVYIDDGANNRVNHTYEIRFDEKNISYSRDGLELYSQPLLCGGLLYICIENTHAGTPESTYVDSVYIRKYTPNEPIIDFWNETIR